MKYFIMGLMLSNIFAFIIGRAYQCDIDRDVDKERIIAAYNLGQMDMLLKYTDDGKFGELSPLTQSRK